ncbi:hypothetical protein HKD37_09G025036 [Glycine soja]
MNFAARKPVEFTPIPVSYADLLPYVLDNSMVAITLAKVHQPPFLREYDSNATCACHGGAPRRSIEHCRPLKRKVQGLIDAGWLKFEENRVFPTSRVQSFWMTGPLDELISCFLIKVDPWVLVPITLRGLYVLAIRGLHILACRGLHALSFRGLRVLIFSVLHIHTLREYKGSRPQDAQWTRRSPIGPWGFQLWLRASVSPTGCPFPQQESHPQRHPVDPEKSNRALGFPAMVTGLCSPTGCLFPPARSRHHDIGLCQFYGVRVAPSKVFRPPTNRAFIKKYCVPRQAQGETPQQPGDGRQRATDAPPSPLEFTSAHPQKG